MKNHMALVYIHLKFGHGHRVEEWVYVREGRDMPWQNSRWLLTQRIVGSVDRLQKVYCVKCL